MDLLVLLRVVPALDASLRGGRLEAFREESATRYRLVFVREGRYDGHLWLPARLHASQH